MQSTKADSWALYSRERNKLPVRHIYLTCAARTLQFLVSPYIGSLSDKYGRKKILLITMVGNILSALV